MFFDVDNCRKMDINDMITLCYIIDEYDSFFSNMVEFFSGKYCDETLFYLLRISRGEQLFFTKKIKIFFEQNKFVLDQISKHSNLISFVTSNYSPKFEVLDDSCFDSFYRYLVLHKSESDRILFLLLKIKDLGFREIVFDESLDFTLDVYQLHTSFSDNKVITYTDNIEVLSDYNYDIVSYKTSESSYRMSLLVIFDMISEVNRRIELNDLLFDPNRLPNDISRELIFNKVIDLKKNDLDDGDSLRKSVCLSVGVGDLDSKFDLICKVVDDLDNRYSKDLKQALSDISNSLDKLKVAISNFNDIICNDYSMTKEEMEEEKKKYLRIKYNSYY